MLVTMTEPLSWLALSFKPTSYFGLGILGLSVIASMSSGSLVKGVTAAVVGLMIATVGADPIAGINRFTFGVPELLGGIEPVLVMVGVFALSELMVQSGAPEITELKEKIKVRLPSWGLMKKLKRSQAIGGIMGLFEGLTPGGGGSIAAFLSYNEARRWSKTPEQFGRVRQKAWRRPRPPTTPWPARR